MADKDENVRSFEGTITPKDATDSKDDTNAGKDSEYAGRQSTAQYNKDDGKNPEWVHPGTQDSAGKGVGTGAMQLSANASDPAAIEAAGVDTSDAERIMAGDKVNLYNINAGLGRRPGGPYLDNLILEQAEIDRAKVERREPDFTNMAGSAGVPLVTAGQLANSVGGGPGLADFIEAHADDSKIGPVPITQVNLVGDGNPEVIRAHKRENEEFDQTTVFSHDDPDVVWSDGSNRRV